MLETEFFNDYADFTADVAHSSYKTFNDNLNRWFDFLFEFPRIREALRVLETHSDFEPWYKKQEQTQGSFVGSADIKWPREKEARLGTQIALFKKFADGSLDPMDFASTSTNAENNFDNMTSILTAQYFRSFASDLLRYFKRVEAPASQIEPGTEDSRKEVNTVPASDRIVSIKHNAPEYQDAIEAFNNLKEAAQGANNYPNAEIRSQRLGELNAGMELLRATQARLKAIAVVIGGALLWFLKKFAGEAVGKFAGIVMDKLEVLFGDDWLSF